jgi:hypothetical protein
MHNWQVNTPYCIQHFIVNYCGDYVCGRFKEVGIIWDYFFIKKSNMAAAFAMVGWLVVDTKNSSKHFCIHNSTWHHVQMK